MAVIRLFLPVFLAIASLAHAGVVVTMVPTPAWDAYEPGQMIGVEVFAQLDAGSPESIRVRLMRFDAGDSDPMMDLNTPRTHASAEVGDTYFWDFSATPICQTQPDLCGGFHHRDGTFEEDHVVEMVHVGNFGPTPEYRITLLQSQPRRVGIMQVTLPSVPGAYLLDLLNVDESDPLRGAELRYGYGIPSEPGNTILRAERGEITGGRYAFMIIPDPPTLSLLLVGTAFLTTKTRNARRKVVP